MAKKKRTSRSSEMPSTVIHVAFGPGGGRIAPEATRELGRRAGEPEPGPSPSGREPVSDLYTQSEVERLLKITRGRLRSLARAGIVAPSGRRRGRRAYTFSDVIALRAARDLLERKVRLRDVARAIERIRKMLPAVTRPLSELRIASDGKQVVVRTQQGAFEPLTGQMLIDFEVRQLRDDVVRVLRPQVGHERKRLAYDLYLRASQCDEHPDTMDEAEGLYRKAVEVDPWLAIAYTNLGNIRFRRGDEAQAEALYRSALQIEATQPEAQYNLGYMMLQRGKCSEAVTYFEGAIDNDPCFADAYFNLAMSYEQLGRTARARVCWLRYLELEPSGTWSDIARKHLGE
ncbi:MAG: tetratricopeptide repeat protein [Polyangiaceae bacterium]|nr:tetratricopeptide repeat protein [Polyangiaceae bacterium]